MQHMTLCYNIMVDKKCYNCDEADNLIDYFGDCESQSSLDTFCSVVAEQFRENNRKSIRREHNI